MKNAIKEIIQSEDTIKDRGSFYHPVCQIIIEIEKEDQYLYKNIELFTSKLLHQLELHTYTMRGMTQVKKLIMNDMVQQSEMMARTFAVGMKNMLNKLPDDLPPDWEFGIDLFLVVTYPEDNNPAIESFIGIKNSHDIPQELEEEFSLLTDIITECAQWILHQATLVLIENERANERKSSKPIKKPVEKKKTLLH